MRNDLVPGRVFPDYRLPDHTGTPRRLSELQGDDPLILTLTRGLQEFRASVGAEWTFLSDPERTVQKDLDIVEYTDPEHNPMIPHTLVLKPGLSSTMFITGIGSGAGLLLPTSGTTFGM